MLVKTLRPHKFSEVIGQQEVIRSLKQLITSGTVPHAMGFLGATGLGKTTVARLVARYINCDSPTQRGCGVCANCTALASGNHPDYLEYNGGNQTGVDEIRELISSVRFRPMLGKKRIVVIDEAQALTPQAQACLLKELEEPSSPDTVFIVCSMDPEKLSRALHTRMQKFQFVEPSNAELRPLLLRIQESIGSPAVQAVIDDSDKFDQVVNIAAGSIREFVQIIDALIHGSDYETTIATLDSTELARKIVLASAVLHLKDEFNPSVVASVVQHVINCKNKPQLLDQILVVANSVLADFAAINARSETEIQPNNQIVQKLLVYGTRNAIAKSVVFHRFTNLYDRMTRFLTPYMTAQNRYLSNILITALTKTD